MSERVAVEGARGSGVKMQPSDKGETMNEIKVFAMNDCDWVAAESLEAASAWYLKELGLDPDDLDSPRELIGEEMDSLQFYDEPPFDGVGKARSFRAQLTQLIAEGVEFPRIFASTEY